jgi:hypothetical protein
MKTAVALKCGKSTAEKTKLVQPLEAVQTMVYPLICLPNWEVVSETLERGINPEALSFSYSPCSNGEKYIDIRQFIERATKAKGLGSLGFGDILLLHAQSYGGDIIPRELRGKKKIVLWRTKWRDGLGIRRYFHLDWRGTKWELVFDWPLYKYDSSFVVAQHWYS